MKVIFFITLFFIFLFGGGVNSPTVIKEDIVYSFDKNSSKNYYSFTLLEDGNIFIVNENPSESHSFRIYDKDFNFIKSDSVIKSKSESLYEGEYLYHCISGSFSLYSNKMKIIKSVENNTTKDKNSSSKPKL